MEDLKTILEQLMANPMATRLGRALVILAIGATLTLFIPGRVSLVGVQPQRMFFVRKVVRYLLAVFTFVWTLRELGFDLGVLLGAAGVLTVAIGFAAQTVASNLISGLFLMGEHPFGVGDIIDVGGVAGEVLSIDALSVKIRTFDNLMVRVPNETMLKSNVTNRTRFPIRRVDMQMGVAYKEDIAKVRELVLAVADANPICLEEPRPLFIFNGYGGSSLDFQLSVWTTHANFLDVRYTMHERIKRVFDENGIEIPFPHRSIAMASSGEPFEVRVTSGD